MNINELEYVFDELKSVYDNLKAEVIVAEIQKYSDLTLDNIIVRNQSVFKRSHRRDILDIGNIENDTLNINLSRNGLYDQLPEGLFHKIHADKTKTSYSELRKTYKKEEKEARHFFLPLENEFFNQKLNIENKERELLNNFLNLDDDFLITFWKVDKTIQKKYLLKLLKLLPYSYKIAGDLELTKLCLEKILNKKVTIKKTYKSKNVDQNCLDEVKQILGTSFTLHHDYHTVLFPTLEVEIGLIEDHEVEEYMQKDSVLKFVNVFYDYFIPIEFDIITKFNVNLKNELSLNNEQQPIMGITTRI